MPFGCLHRKTWTGEHGRSGAVKALSTELGHRMLKLTVPSGIGGALALGGRAPGALPALPLDGAMTAMLFRHWGTPSNTPMAITSGDGPIKNWEGGPKEAKELIKPYNPDKINKIEKVKYHCYSCPLGCGGKLNLKNNHYTDYSETHKPEYETIEAFGPL